jgi:hypothetical protein
MVEDVAELIDQLAEIQELTFRKCIPQKWPDFESCHTEVTKIDRFIEPIHIVTERISNVTETFESRHFMSFIGGEWRHIIPTDLYESEVPVLDTPWWKFWK